jgi:transcriptional regulator NrdR family protein
MISIIKRGKHQEAYDERKVYASIFAAALNCHYADEKAEKLAARVVKAVTGAVKRHAQASRRMHRTKSPLTSHDIRNFIIKYCSDPEVTFMYIHHLDLC